MRNMSLLKLTCCLALALGSATADAGRWVLVICPPANPTAALDGVHAPTSVITYFTQRGGPPVDTRSFAGWSARTSSVRSPRGDVVTTYTLVRPPDQDSRTFLEWSREQQNAAVWNIFRHFFELGRADTDETLLVWQPVADVLSRAHRRWSTGRGMHSNLIRLMGPRLMWSIQAFGSDEDVDGDELEANWLDRPSEGARPTFDLTHYSNLQTRALARTLGRRRGLKGLDYVVRLVGLYLPASEWDRLFLPIGALLVHTVS